MKLVIPMVLPSKRNTASINNTLEFAHKGNGVYEALVPVAFPRTADVSTAPIRQVKITVTSQTMTTKSGVCRALTKVEVPYTSVDSDGAFLSKGVITGHFVLSLPKAAISDFTGANGEPGRALAVQQAGLVRTLCRVFENANHDIDDQSPIVIEKTTKVDSEAGLDLLVNPLVEDDALSDDNKSALAPETYPAEPAAPLAKRCVLAEGTIAPATARGDIKANVPESRSACLYGTDSVKGAGGITLWMNASRYDQIQDAGQMSGVRSLIARVAAGLRPIADGDVVAPTVVLVTSRKFSGV